MHNVFRDQLERIAGDSGEPHAFPPLEADMFHGDVAANFAGQLRRAGEGMRLSKSYTWLARLGLAAKGVVYVLVGAVAFQVSRGERTEVRDAKGSLLTLAGGEWGGLILGFIGVSLLGYVVWRFVEAIRDPERRGKGVKGILKRLGYLFSGLIYLGVAIFSLRLATGGSARPGGGTESWAARLLSMPLGEWWVFLAGLGVMIYGVAEIVKGWREDFGKELPSGVMDASRRHAAVRFGKAGLAARGVVLTLMGLFLLKAAMASDASQAQGVDGALNALARQEYGVFLLAAAAAGLACYGVFQVIQARYRRITA